METIVFENVLPIIYVSNAHATSQTKQQLSKKSIYYL